MGVQLCGKTFREKISFETVTENRQSLCGYNVRWKTVPESTASSGKSTIADHDQRVNKRVNFRQNFVCFW